MNLSNYKPNDLFNPVATIVFFAGVMLLYEAVKLPGDCFTTICYQLLSMKMLLKIEKAIVINKLEFLII